MHGQSRTLCVFCSENSTYYHVAPTRNRALVREMLGENFSGVLVSDCLSIYDGVNLSSKNAILIICGRLAKNLNRRRKAHLSKTSKECFLMRWRWGGKKEEEKSGNKNEKSSRARLANCSFKPKRHRDRRKKSKTGCENSTNTSSRFLIIHASIRPTTLPSANCARCHHAQTERRQQNRKRSPHLGYLVQHRGHRATTGSKHRQCFHETRFRLNTYVPEAPPQEDTMNLLAGVPL